MKALIPALATTTSAMVSALVYGSPVDMQVLSEVHNSHKEVSQMIMDPKNLKEIFENLKYVVEHDLALDDGFYDEAHLKNIFALDSIYRKDETVDGDRKILVMSNAISQSFEKIYGCFLNVEFTANVNGGISIRKNGQTEGVISFYASNGGPTFSETQNIFGNGLIKLSPRFPGMYGRPQPANGPHGGEAWKQQWTNNNIEKELTLNFHADGELSNVLLKISKITN